VNLIHLDDIAEAILRLLDQAGPLPRPLYVLSDGRPVERREFYLAMAEIFGTPPPQFVEPEAGSSRGGRSESNKRIDPSRILRDLGLVLRYPDYRSGLAAIARSEPAA
jgi:nucleoside-diphosphate-sugar epimerase